MLGDMIVSKDPWGQSEKYAAIGFHDPWSETVSCTRGTTESDALSNGDGKNGVAPAFYLQSSMPYGANRSDSRDRCDNLDHDGRTNWRLPTLNELYLIRDVTRGTDKFPPAWGIASSVLSGDAVWHAGENGGGYTHGQALGQTLVCVSDVE